MKIMMSACLTGKKCRYDGGDSKRENALRLLENNEYILICPECAGGLEIPREPCEISAGDGADVLDGKAKVLDRRGKDRTKEFIAGAYAILKQACEYAPDKIYLKAKSPSCGVGQIYDGTFNGNLTAGNGVAAELLRRNGFDVEAI